MKELFFQPVSKVSTIISDGMRKSIKNGATAEYNIDSELSLVGRADAIADDIVIKFEVVDKLPKMPDPEGLLNLNATMYLMRWMVSLFT